MLYCGCRWKWIVIIAVNFDGLFVGYIMVMVSKLSIHVQYIRTESDRLGYATVRLTGSPIARDLEKYTEVFTEGVECWRIDSIGYGRARSVFLCVGSTERKSDRERLRKIHLVFTEDVKCSQSYSIGHGPSFWVSTWLTRTPMFLKRLKEFTILNVTELIVVSHKWRPQSQLRWL